MLVNVDDDAIDYVYDKTANWTMVMEWQCNSALIKILLAWSFS